MKKPLPPLGKAIKKFCIDHNLTQEFLAKKMKLSPCFVSKVILGNGRCPTSFRNGLLNIMCELGSSESEIEEMDILMIIQNGTISTKGMSKEKINLLLKLVQPMNEQQVAQIQEFLTQLKQGNQNG